VHCFLKLFLVLGGDWGWRRDAGVAPGKWGIKYFL
jgi:hypothetical protein